MFSKIFEKYGRRQIGLYGAGFSSGMLGLRMGIIIECFKALGKYGNLNKSPNKWDKVYYDI